MRNFTKKSVFIILLSVIISGGSVMAQNILQYMRPVNQDGVNQFEPSKEDTVGYDGFKVRVGGDFALQLQGLSHSNGLDSMPLAELVTNFNLPTANLNLDVQLAKGMRLHLRTYLSSRHHSEAWVKGGYLQMDNLDFIADGFLSGLMNYTRIKVGMDEFNYGDAHFRRSDNARVLANPFVGNYIMDAFSTEVFGEATVMASGFIGVIGLTNGKLNQNVTVTNRYNGDNKLSFFGKVGYDNYLTNDLRVRLTASWYMNDGTTTGGYLHSGDRAGARYYSVMADSLSVAEGSDNFRSGRFNHRFSQVTAIMVNPFLKYKGLEIFGLFEIVNDGSDNKGSYTQIGVEPLFRFGGKEQFYVGARYNKVSGEASENAETIEISRINAGGGWFITKNVLAKVEYVSQTYTGDGWNGTYYEGGEFSGLMLEAAISF